MCICLFFVGLRSLASADFFLDLISTAPQQAIDRHQLTAPPGLSSATTWTSLYKASPFMVSVQPPTTVKSTGTASSSEVARFGVLFKRLLVFNARAPEYYLRTLQLVLIGLYLGELDVCVCVCVCRHVCFGAAYFLNILTPTTTGTLYLRLPKDTSRLTELSGASFFNIWVVLFSVVASVPMFARDRRLVQQEVANGSYRYVTHSLSHFLASIPFNLLCAIFYQCVFHYLVGFNDLFSAWVYSVAISMSLMLAMEGIVLCVIEGLKDPMLSVTFSMVCVCVCVCVRACVCVCVCVFSGHLQTPFP
jgi:hypothetical protein